ncbi:NAD(P)-dependent oxidoreductase [Variovorax terrae]|uniref:NAD(P)-dependent oxidoreductase n=1 Tax=Variovorax terrae TaxID=2923278 RepID=A0A9X2ALK1_9BURK|nr:NAD(P)-dependent oxidoreductase [Variovorax terrae]MCJ0762783.1 NAD(P)-dependent oxidoreductase [Variovorax terrae]
MNVFIFGASGTVGSALVQEALRRGHQVTAAARNATGLTAAGVKAVQADATSEPEVRAAVAGHDAVIAAVSGRKSGHDTVPAIARNLLSALPAAGVNRLLWVGGAGSLEVAPGVRLVDTPNFPEAYKDEALGQGRALDVFRASASPLNWTCVSPAALLAPGERTGQYRTGGDQLLVDAEGNSRISVADFAVAMIDEMERNAHPRTRITVAY